MAYLFTITDANGNELSQQSTANVWYDKTRHRAILGPFNEPGGIDVTDYILDSPGAGWAALTSLDGVDDAEKDILLQYIYERNYRAEHNGQAPPPVGSTSLLSNLWDRTVAELSLSETSIFRQYLQWGVILGAIALVFVFRNEIKGAFRAAFGKGRK